MNRFCAFLLSFATLFALLTWYLRRTDRAHAQNEAEEEILDDAPLAAEPPAAEVGDTPTADGYRLVLNTNSKILHLDDGCRALRHIQEENRTVLEKADPDTLVALGYTVCGICASALRK